MSAASAALGFIFPRSHILLSSPPAGVPAGVQRGRSAPRPAAAAAAAAPLPRRLSPQPAPPCRSRWEPARSSGRCSPHRAFPPPPAPARRAGPRCSSSSSRRAPAAGRASPTVGPARAHAVRRGQAGGERWGWGGEGRSAGGGGVPPVKGRAEGKGRRPCGGREVSGRCCGGRGAAAATLPPPLSPRLASGTGWAPSSAEIPGKSLFDGAGGGGGDLPRSEQPTTRFSDLLPAQARCWQAGELTGFSASRRGGCPTAPRGMPWPKGRSDRWPSSGHGFTVRWWAVASGWGGLAGKAPRFYCGELCLRRLQPGRCL